MGHAWGPIVRISALLCLPDALHRASHTSEATDEGKRLDLRKIALPLALFHQSVYALVSQAECPHALEFMQPQFHGIEFVTDLGVHRREHMPEITDT